MTTQKGRWRTSRSTRPHTRSIRKMTSSVPAATGVDVMEWSKAPDFRRLGTDPVPPVARVSGRTRRSRLRRDQHLCNRGSVHRACRRSPSNRVREVALAPQPKNTLRRLADHLHVPDNGVLQLLGSHKLLSAGRDEAGDTVATFNHVVQVEQSSFTAASPRVGCVRERTNGETSRSRHGPSFQANPGDPEPARNGP